MTTETIKEWLKKAWSALKRFGKAAWAYIKKAKIELIVIAAVILFDQITKAIVQHTLGPNAGGSATVIPNFLVFYYSKNDKAAFGGAFGLDKAMGPDALMGLLIAITFVALIVFCVFMYRSRSQRKWCVISYACIIAGAFGNLIDRMAFGYVRDFIQVVYFGLEFNCNGTVHDSFAIFNIADAALVTGVIMFAIYYLFMYKDPKVEAAKAKKSAQLQAEDNDFLLEDDDLNIESPPDTTDGALAAAQPKSEEAPDETPE